MENLLTLVFLSILCLSTICINANPLHGVKGIEAASQDEFPFIVSIGVAPANLPEHHICGGTLISKKHILTARHCYVNPRTNQPLRKNSDIRVTVGSIDNTLGRKYNVTHCMTYGDWATRNNVAIEYIYHDLAIATSAENVDDVAPVIISKCKHKQIRGRNAVTAGWSIGNDGLHKQFLEKASLHVISRKICRLNYNTVYELPYMVVNHLCTIQRPPVTLGCGDSGGPLWINGNQLVGVNEGVCADDIDHPNEQNSHQSAEYYRKFIESFAEKTAPCPPKS